MAMDSVWSASGFSATLLMWTVMMGLMMLPSSIPMLRAVAVVSRGAQTRGERGTPVSIVTLGYVLAWSVFSVGASVVQLWLHGRMLLCSNEALIDGRVAAAVLLVAGAYQFTPVKAACLGHCRSPFPMLLHRWTPGTAGAIRIGFAHGTSCVACCWPLMLVLFIVGVMNVLWIALLAGVVAIERLAPGAQWPRWVVGMALTAWGAMLLA